MADTPYMVSNEVIDGIVTREARTFNLTPVQTAKLRRWANNWREDFTTDREYTARAVTTMTRNVAQVAKTDKTWMETER